MKIVFCDTNKVLVKKVQELFDKLGDGNGMEFSTNCGDVFKFKDKNPDYKLCTASNPRFTMGGGLDAQIAKHYPNEVKGLKEFVWTDNLFPIITVDNNIKSSRDIIKRCFAGIYAYRNRFNFIFTGIGTAIGGLNEGVLLEELADLIYANLRYANLRYADLRSADLSYADLRSADLSYADLRSADLSSANLKNIIQNEITINFNLVCPEEGDFIGRKKCENGVIVKLLIPATAKRSSATTRKCRASYVKTLEIRDRRGKNIKEGISYYNKEVKYKVGKITKCDKREEDRRIECGGGIHFFMTRLEAEQY